MDHIFEQLYNIAIHYSESYKDLGDTFDRLFPPSKFPSNRPASKPRYQGYDLEVVEGTEAALDLFFLTHLKTIQSSYPKLYEEQKAKLEPTMEKLLREQVAWIIECNELINEMEQGIAERNFKKKQQRRKTVHKKLQNPTLLDHRHHAMAFGIALDKGKALTISPNLVELLVLTDADTEAGVRDLSDKQKFGLALLLIKGKQKGAIVTNGFRTVRRQAELMVQNHLVVNHPDFPKGKIMVKVEDKGKPKLNGEVQYTRVELNKDKEKRVKSLSIYWWGVYDALSRALQEIIDKGGPYSLLAAEQKKKYGEKSVPKMTEKELKVWAKKAMEVLLKSNDPKFRAILKGLTDAARDKVDARVDAYTDYENGLAAAIKNDTLEAFKKKNPTAPKFPASHSSGNVVDLDLGENTNMTDKGPFSKILNWGIDVGIVKSFKAEFSHLHIVLER